jgi:hypothetical protein
MTKSKGRLEFESAVNRLARAIAQAETLDTLPRCVHGGCLIDGAGERLEPPCGCRAPAPPANH